MPEFRGTQCSNLVLNPISYCLPPQLQAPWAQWHKKDAAGRWITVIDMPTRPPNAPHVAPDILHLMYPRILGWATDLLATPQQKFPAGSPSQVKVQCVPRAQAPGVLEASTLSLREDDMVGQVLDLVSPPWRRALALHVASGLCNPMAPCTPQELVRTPRVPELSLAAWIAPGTRDTPTSALALK